MIFVRIEGGLGNQMFQYAAGRALADKYNTDLVIDNRIFDQYILRSYNLDKFKIRARLAKKCELQKYSNWRYRVAERLREITSVFGIYIEPSFCFDKKWSSVKNGTYLSGYFQSEKYFQDIRIALVHDFVPQESLDSKNLQILQLIKNTKSVMIHVRRGDYVTDPIAASVHGVCSLNYYEKAIQKMREEFANLTFFVFSDDIAWCRENLNFGNEAFFVEGNEKNPEKDLYLMSNCKHHIIANSSFSWWSAWIGSSPTQKVIVPSPWFDSISIDDLDLIPKKWERLIKK